MPKLAVGDRLDILRLNGFVEGTIPFEKLVLNPATTTVVGNQDNYAFDALAVSPQIGVTALYWNGASLCTLRGLAGGADGRLLWVANVTAAQSLTINNEDTNSTAANRILTASGGALTIAPGQFGLLFYSGSALRWRLITFNSAGATYVLDGWAGSGVGATFSPADSTTYYVGRMDSVSTPNPKTSAALQRIYIPKAGRITSARVTFRIANTLASSETFTAAVRLNNTTDTTISAACKMDASQQTFVNSALSIAVAVGDYVEIKIVTPVWATNPSDVQIDVQLFVEP